MESLSISTLKNLFDSLDEVCWVGSLDNTFYLNPAYEKVWEQSPEDGVDPFLQQIHPDDEQKVQNLFQSTDEKFYCNYRIQTESGTKLLSVISRKMENEQGLWFRKARLLEKDEKPDIVSFEKAKLIAIDNIINVIVNQWKEPLNMISMAAQSLRILQDDNQLTADTVIQSEKQIVKEISFLDATIYELKRILKPAKRKEIFFLDEVVADIVKLLTPRCKKLGIVLEVSEQKLKTKAYLNEFKIVLLNLLTNSMEAHIANRGVSPFIKISLEQSGDRVYMFIADNAGGIRESMLPDQLFQLHVTTKSHGSAGVGLYITKEILEKRMESSISCSNKNSGACFEMSFPLYSETVFTADKRILVAEDDELVRTTLHYFLKTKFEHIYLASNGLEAFEIFKNHPIDLLLTDVNMPEMNGNDLIKKVRNTGKPLKIAVLTAYKEDLLYSDLVDQILLKPILRESFLNEMDALMEL